MGRIFYKNEQSVYYLMKNPTALSVGVLTYDSVK